MMYSWIWLMLLGQYHIVCYGRPLITSESQVALKHTFWIFNSVLLRQYGVHPRVATARDRGHGGMYNLPTHFHNGDGGHYQGLKVGSGWGVVAGKATPPRVGPSWTT